MSKVFVFGSNLAGRHGMGAALHAKLNFGAKYGVGEGMTGNSYALPTKGYKLEIRSLEEIQNSVDEFIETAKFYKEKEFQVTRVGCGLAGYKDHQIAPMFKGVPSNCELPEEWVEILERTRKEELEREYEELEREYNAAIAVALLENYGG